MYIYIYIYICSGKTKVWPLGIGENGSTLAPRILTRGSA